MRRPEDPIHYFRENSFTESLVLSIDHDPENAALRIVVVHVDLPRLLERPSTAIPGWPAPPRDFRELLFSGTNRARRTGTRYREGFLGFNPRDLNLSPERRINPVIEAIEVRTATHGFAAAIPMGSLGEYRFAFRTLEVAQRLGRTVKREGSGWDHFDAETGEPFDFHRPFEPRSITRNPGAGPMHYLAVEWRHNDPHDPILIFSELDDDRWEVRKVERCRDGRATYAGPDGQTGDTYLDEIAFPSLDEIAADPEFIPREISPEEFEAAWQAAHRL